MINSQLLLYLNLGFGLLLVLYFLLGRPKTKPPTRLNMRAKETLDKKPLVLEPEIKKEVIIAPEVPRETVRSLAVIFIFNGHDFEAHEALGVPQGSSMHLVTTRYQELVKTADAGSLQFYEQAYLAISDRHRSRRL